MYNVLLILMTHKSTQSSRRQYLSIYVGNNVMQQADILSFVSYLYYRIPCISSHIVSSSTR